MTEETRRRRATDESNDDGTDLAIEAPATSRPDERIAIRITGAAPGERVTLGASVEDADGVTWRSRATFEADVDGVVDLTDRAPVSGSYDGVRPMGWLWSMAADDEEQPVIPLLTPDPTPVRLRAVAGGAETEPAPDDVAERTITRTVGDGVVRTDVDRDGLAGTIYEPAGDEPRPGVLALHGSGATLLERPAALLAARGFAAFALRYAGDHDAVPDRIREVPLTYFDRAASWFRGRPGVRDGPLGVLGQSRGAEVGLLLGARREWVGAAVSYAGSGVVWDTPTGDPAWLDADGVPVPYVTGQQKPTLREGQLDEADEATVRAATIPVEDIDGPVLFLSGAEDPIWPARRTADAAMERLERAAFEHACEHLSFDDVGHFVTPPYVPKTDPRFGGSPGGIARADAESWPLVLEYLEKGLEADSDAES